MSSLVVAVEVPDNSLHVDHMLITTASTRATGHHCPCLLKHSPPGKINDQGSSDQEVCKIDNWLFTGLCNL